ncbi:MAG: hypothetical protein WDW21_05295 [Neisseriaceae bacterium]
MMDKPLKDILMLKNHAVALDFVAKALLVKKEKINLRNLRGIQALLEPKKKQV